MSAADTAAAIAKRFVADATSAIDDASVLVRAGHPGTNQPPDIVCVGRVTMHSEHGPLTPRRPLDVTWTVAVKVSVERGGTEDAEEVCRDRAHQLLNLLEEYVRVDDVDLGGLVWWCRLSDYDGDGVWDEALLEDGRLFEIDATFTAQGRITS